MTFILEARDQSTPRTKLVLPNIVWGTVAGLLSAHRILPADLLERASYHGTGAGLDAEQAERVADFLDGWLRDKDLHALLLPDGTVTRDPEALERSRTDVFFVAAPVARLPVLRDFCRASGGFDIF